MKNNPTFTIIAGVNGSGKTIFALDYFKNTAVVFMNAGLIATGLSPTNPDISQFSAGKLMLDKIKKCIESQTSFAVETILASKNYLKVIKNLKAQSWQINMIYSYLPSVDLSIYRVAERVKNGGHNINLKDIKRIYDRSVKNLINNYFDVIDAITCLSNYSDSKLIFKKNKDKVIVYNQDSYDEILGQGNVG